MMRPILKSASLFLGTTLVVHYGVQFFFPASSFFILASKDLGKIVFTLLAFGALAHFVHQQSKTFRTAWLKRNFYFLGDGAGLRRFAAFFLLFFGAHVAFLALCSVLGFASLQGVAVPSTLALTGKLIFGFFVTFLLALTEEIIFRGTFFYHFKRWMSELNAVLLTSLFFMTVHFLPNPIMQIYHDWHTALGLFLLGTLLNLINIKWGTMYANIGCHAGLVFVKVVLRKIRFFAFVSPSLLPWFLHADLRQAPIVHFFFAIISLSIIFSLRREQKI